MTNYCKCIPMSDIGVVFPILSYTNGIKKASIHLTVWYQKNWCGCVVCTPHLKIALKLIPDIPQLLLPDVSSDNSGVTSGATLKHSVVFCVQFFHQEMQEDLQCNRAT